MNIYEGCKMAVKTIASYKMRTFLTMLGILIGISSVIILVSFANGTRQQVKGQIESLGSNLIYANIIGRGTKTTLSYDQAMSIGQTKGVKAISPVLSLTATVKRNENSMDGIAISGTNSDYATLQNLSMKKGRFLVPLDLKYRSRAAVIGANIAQNFFGFVNPVGETIQLNGVSFQVIGVLNPKGSSISGSADDKIFIPESIAEQTFYAKGVKSVFIQASSPQSINHVMTKIDKRLKSLFANDTQSYKLRNEQDKLNTVNAVSNMMTYLLVGIAGISLLVGGIGIMNIMLVSVTERTKEIGIRKALGARKFDILGQFLIESTMITLLAGILGILVGVLGISILKTSFQMAAIISVNIIWISIIFSSLIGVVFGILPAYKASKLKPIEALRFE